tara:strand:+ start:401 stop:604 length:204 start_codon:yes stop_codon:yes gene_type:complete
MKFTFVDDFTKEQNKLLESIMIKDKIVVRTPEQIQVYKEFVELINKDIEKKTEEGVTTEDYHVMDNS